MSTFSKPTFNATRYAASRPHYPRALYSHVLEYAAPEPTTSSPRTLVDVGCGPGLSTFEFGSSRAFDRIIGVDPSAAMIRAAEVIRDEKEQSHAVPPGKFAFKQGKVDQLEAVGIEPESVDLVVAGQAAHWFDALPTYESLARVLKPGGSFIFWGYGEIFFRQRPELSALIPPYSGQLLGPYWEQPGRSIVENLLVQFPLPIPANFLSTLERDRVHAACDKFDAASLRRTFHLADPSRVPDLLDSERDRIGTSTHSILLTKQWTLEGLEGYLQTWSSLHKYREEKGEAHDIVADLLKRLREQGWRDGDEVEACWEMGMLMGKKK